ncbi:MAG TPA: porin [Phnomibacter sp.]|nr:porin [Phnomibacter sp.]
MRRFVSGFGAGYALVYQWCLTGLLCFAGNTPLFAQVESDERPLAVSTEGLIFNKDSVFRLSMRFRMQNRFGYFSKLDAEPGPGFEAQVRRLRLRFDGYVGSPKLGYYIQLSFSRSDQDLVSGTIAQTVRDAMVYYTFSKRFYMGFGQSKLPGNRERVISSGNLQLPDRSIANNLYTLDRDFGFFGYYTLPMGKQVLSLKTAITEGEGRGQNITTTGLAYTGRLEWLPLGTFKNTGDYSEGDNEFEPSPKLSLAAGYSYNHRTVRSGGQLGSTLPAPVNMGTFIADLMFKYSGWGLMAEYFNRRVDGFDETSAHLSTLRKVPEGVGYNLQGSRMLGRKDEITLRYAAVQPTTRRSLYQLSYISRQLGYTHYFNKHRIKLQYVMGLDDRQQPGTNPNTHLFKNRWVSMLQVELGI